VSFSITKSFEPYARAYGFLAMGGHSGFASIRMFEMVMAALDAGHFKSRFLHGPDPFLAINAW
jgi:hypothetical protein